MNEKRRNQGSAIVAFTFVCAVTTAASIVAGAVNAVIEEARDKEQTAVVEVAINPGTDVPELYVIPGLIAVEPNDSDENYENAP